MALFYQIGVSESIYASYTHCFLRILAWGAEKMRRKNTLLCLLALPLLALAALSPQEEKLVALTFDDGPWPQTTAQLLDGLAERNAKATFFLIGEQIDGREELVQRMAHEGHQVGSHTWSHCDLFAVSPETALGELSRTDARLAQLLGEGEYWLRPPWGFLGEEVAAEISVPMLYWSLDTEDWRLRDEEAVYRAIVDNVQPGDVVLLHDPYPTTVNAVLRAIDTLAQQGYHFVTAQQLFAHAGVAPQQGVLYASPTQVRQGDSG